MSRHRVKRQDRRETNRRFAIERFLLSKAIRKFDEVDFDTVVLSGDEGQQKRARGPIVWPEPNTYEEASIMKERLAAEVLPDASPKYSKVKISRQKKDGRFCVKTYTDIEKPKKKKKTS